MLMKRLIQLIASRTLTTEKSYTLYNVLAKIDHMISTKIDEKMRVYSHGVIGDLASANIVVGDSR